MAEAGPIRRFVIPVLCLGATALAINNVYGDMTQVERLAEQTACGKQDCSVRVIEMSRTPLSHTYVYQTSVAEQKTARVGCAREMVLLGDYECELE